MERPVALRFSGDPPPNFALKLTDRSPITEADPCAGGHGRGFALSKQGTNPVGTKRVPEDLGKATGQALEAVKEKTSLLDKKGAAYLMKCLKCLVAHKRGHIVRLELN